MENLDKKMTSRIHERISSFFVASWLLGGLISFYCIKQGYIDKEIQEQLLMGYFLLWMSIDLCLGVYFKEFPQFIAVIKYGRNPKSYFVRISFNCLLIAASGYFLLR